MTEIRMGRAFYHGSTDGRCGGIICAPPGSAAIRFGLAESRNGSFVACFLGDSMRSCFLWRDRKDRKMRIRNLLFVVAMLLVAMNASAQWNISGGAENTPLNMVVQGSATIGANVNPTSSALEVRSNAGNYNTLFGMKTSDFNSGVAGSLVIFGFNANTGNTTSLLQGYTNGSNSVGNLALNYLGGNVGIGTPTPASNLEVNGNAFFNGTVTGTNMQALYQD